MTGDITFEVRVRSRDEAADGVAVIELERPGGVLPNWAPGAHIDIVLADGRERQYSLCGSPAERDHWRIGVLREREVSAWLHDHALEGASLRVRAPSNHFMFAPTAGRSYVFVAGGIGITAILPMIDAAAHAGSEWTLLYAGRSRRAMAFVDDLVAAHGDRVQVFAADEGARLDIPACFADAALRTIVYACGPARLLEELETSLAHWPRGTLHVERFEAKVLGPPVWTGPFEVDLMLSGEVLVVPPDRSILEVAEEHGVLAVSSCRVGTCGTCEVGVIDGEIEHRDSVLSPEEQEDSRSMLICVSRAACPRIMLEL